MHTPPRRPLLVCSLTAILLIFSTIGVAEEIPIHQAEWAGFSREHLGEVMPKLQKLVDDQKISGATILVSRSGKVVLFDAVGEQEIGADKPMKPDTIMRIFSMTKPITTAAAMILVDEGKLSLDDPVSKYLPEFDNQQVFLKREGDDLLTAPVKTEMTIRDLMRHTSGLTYGLYGNTEVDKLYRRARFLDRGKSLENMTQRLSKLPLQHQPATTFNYSMSHDVLARVVEVVSQQRFDKFLKERIFIPLEMHDTGFHVPKEKLDRFSANYAPKSAGGLRTIDTPRFSRYLREPVYLSGGGGLLSTASDYWRFSQMILNRGQLNDQRILSEKSVAEMTRNQLPDEAYPISMNGRREGVGYGLGFSVVVEKTDFTRNSHIGELAWGGAASTHFWISPKDQLVVVVLTQVMPFSFEVPATIKPLIYDALMEPFGASR